MLHDLWREVRLGARRLASAWIFFVFAVISLATGLSVTTTAYSIFARCSGNPPRRRATRGQPERRAGDLRGLRDARPGIALDRLGLTTVGLYGIQMHAVAGRTREVGVRMALGATVRQIQSLVLREGYRPVFVGVAIGIVLGLIGRLALKSVVVARFQAVDSAAIALVALALGAAAFLACWLPARRAARVDPNVALRHL